MSIRVVGLSKRFTEDVVVRDVSFEAPEGKLTTLLGPSGSGKSTILRVIAGLEMPETGRVHIGGQDATELPAQARNVGFVFQQFALFQHLTVRENVGFGLVVRKRAREEVEARVTELLRLVQLQEFGARRPAQLSGGQRQRVALARALAPKPTVLLLDEPFGALDARVRAELRAWLRQLHTEIPVTTLMVTHDQEEAMELSDRVVVMNAGKIEQVGAPAEIYDKPATPFVASFVGSANVLSGRVQGGHIGPFPVSAPEGKVVHAFVRPHDVEIKVAAAGPLAAVALAQKTPAEEGSPSVAGARVARLVRIGWQVKVHLVLADGQPLVVQMTKDEVEAMRIQEGDRVFVNVKEARVFVQDYSI